MKSDFLQIPCWMVIMYMTFFKRGFIKQMKTIIGMKKFIISFSLPLLLGLVVAFPLSAFADDRNSFYIYVNSSSKPETFSLNSLNKITFTNSSMKMWEDTKMTEIPFSSIDFLTLDEEQTPSSPITSVKEIATDENICIKYQASGDVVIVEGKEALEGVAIYDLQGRLVISDNSAAKAYRLSVAKVRRGMFIVKVTDNGKVKSQKLVK